VRPQKSVSIAFFWWFCMDLHVDGFNIFDLLGDLLDEALAKVD
jgi:hypothetical protein